MLPFIVAVSAILTAVFSAMLLGIYKRAVVRSMGVSSGQAAPVSCVDASFALNQTPRLKLIRVDISDPASSSGEATNAAISASLRRLGFVYTAAGLGYAIVLSVPWMLAAGDGFPLTRFIWLIMCYVWPTVIVLLLAVSTTNRQRCITVGVYFGLVVGIGIIARTRNPEMGFGELIFFWFFVNGAGTVLLTAFLTRSIRAVGPLVLTFMVVGVTGAFLAVAGAGSNDALLRGIVTLGDALGLDATTIFVLLHFLGFALFGVLGWWVLSWLGRAYRSKRISDQSLNVDALLLMFGVLQSITLAFEGWGWIFTGLVAFGVYKLIVMLGFRYLTAINARISSRPRSLLFLRVFALGRRSARLFDAFSKRWLRVGNINLIAGPDLATTTVEPHEFLEFMGGKLSRLFLKSEGDVVGRLAERDTWPDPDGRHRVNEFFCQQDVWQMTMQRLAADSDAVLMDLRSFSPHNQGCLWELEQLLVGVPLESVLLVTDDTTDQTFLEETLQRIWQRVSAQPPYTGHKNPSIRLFRYQPPSPEPPKPW